MVKRADLEPLIVQEWLRRPGGERKEGDVLIFYSHLTQHCPDLLSFRASGDKYQLLHTILRHHIERGR